MHDATNRLPNFRLAITPGAPTPRVSELLVLQRVEEPELTIAVREVAIDELVAGLCEGLYDAGISLQDSSHPSLRTQTLWADNMAVAMPLMFPAFGQAKVTIEELLQFPVLRWNAEICPLLDQHLSSSALSPQRIQREESFETMMLWVTSGYGVAVTAQSRIAHVLEGKIAVRQLVGGPYELVTYLLRPNGPVNQAAERLERRALRVAQRS